MISEPYSKFKNRVMVSSLLRILYSFLTYAMDICVCLPKCVRGGTCVDAYTYKYVQN